MNKSVAIDGPAGAGKSTLARRLAQRLGFLYVDTGAIYRTVGLYTLRNRLAPEEVVPMLEKLDIRMEYDSGGVQRMRLNGEDVSEAIRVHEVSQRASQVAALPEVRAFLLDFQRRQAREHSVVMDGRDIGTVVLPDADVKIFLTASPEVRAKRRLLELEQRGQPAQYEQILQDIQDRDRQDRNRAAAPLRQAEDAVLLDTSGLDLEQSLTQMLEYEYGYGVSAAVYDLLADFQFPPPHQGGGPGEHPGGRGGDLPQPHYGGRPAVCGLCAGTAVSRLGDGKGGDFKMAGTGLAAQ